MSKKIKDSLVAVCTNCKKKELRSKIFCKCGALLPSPPKPQEKPKIKPKRQKPKMTISIFVHMLFMIAIGSEISITLYFYVVNYFIKGLTSEALVPLFLFLWSVLAFPWKAGIKVAKVGFTGTSNGSDGRLLDIFVSDSFSSSGSDFSSSDSSSFD